MEALEDVPSWWLKKRFARGGMRLPKLPELTVEKPALLPIRAFGFPKDDPDRGNFQDFSMYRYLIGSRVVSSEFSMCRVCEVSLYNSWHKSEHRHKMHEGRTCIGWFHEALRHLKDSTKCVVCESRTSKQIWGITLCGDSCKIRWMFESKKWGAVKAALDRVGYKMPTNNRTFTPWRGE